MKILLAFALTVLSSTAFANRQDFYREFNGDFIAGKGGDCKEGQVFDLRFDEKKGQVVLRSQRKEVVVIPDTGPVTYSVDKNNLLTIIDPHLALHPENSNEVTYGEEGGKSIYVNEKRVQLDKDLKGNDEVYILIHTEINLSKDRRTLTYYIEKNDFISDPHQAVCELSRVTK